MAGTLADTTTGTLAAAVAGTFDIPCEGYSRLTIVLTNTGESNAIGTNSLLVSMDGTTFAAIAPIGTAVGSLATGGTSVIDLANLVAHTVRVSLTSADGSTYSAQWLATQAPVTGATECRVNGELVATSSAGALSATTLTVSGATTLNGAVTLGDAAADDITVSGVIAGSVSLKKEGAHTISVAASTTTDTAGGALTIAAGAGGATNANGGALALDAGAKAGSGTDGAITIGATAAESVTIGRTGKTTTIPGALAVTQGTTLTGALTCNGAVTVQAADAGAAATSGTVNAHAGTFTLSSGNAAYTLTNNKIAATSLLFATCVSGAVAQSVYSFVPGSGSAVLTLSGAAGADSTFAFLVVTPGA